MTPQAHSTLEPLLFFYMPSTASLLIKNLTLIESKDELSQIPDGKQLINTINAYSYTMTKHDDTFAKALLSGYLVPDGASIVEACKLINAKSHPKERIAGWDLFVFEMGRQEKRAQSDNRHHKVMFMGSSPNVLSLIEERARKIYPHLDIITYSPPYKPSFSDEENRQIVNAINEAQPDLLWIGMTAPKQEKWVFEHWQELNIKCHVGTIGAVFDFFACTAKRAPQWWQEHSLEWLYRLVKEPRRMWRRYILGNCKFLYYIIQEKFS